MTITIGFIGAGNMASALVGGLLARGHQPQYLALADANTSQLAGFTEQHIFTTTNNADIFQRADVIVLAVKPQVISGYCSNQKTAHYFDCSRHSH